MEIKNGIEVKNYMENLVSYKIKEFVEKGNCKCSCAKCIADITAISLNNLSPRYTVTEKGNFYAKVDSYENQSMIDVVTAVSNAIKIVEKNPRHEE